MNELWTTERAWAWHRAVGWRCGFNYVPSTAINPIELWASETFDPQTIDRELGWAGGTGFNTLRVNLHYFAYEADAAGFLERMDRFLSIASAHGFGSMFCLFDDCAHRGQQPRHGRQDPPVPGLHNSGWTPSPGHAQAVDPAFGPKLQAYVRDVVRRFARDARVLLWDLYNEPGNGTGLSTVPLLRECFAWARQEQPDQPISSGVWQGDYASPPPGSVSEAMIELSDVVTFHNYEPLPQVQQEIESLRRLDRPMFCTEWMARTRGSRFETHLPVFRAQNIGCCFWGLINGKSQTNFPWGSPPNAPEPELWFHDLLRTDGRPYMEEEVRFARGVLRGRA